jgi:hypothetical protein
MADGDNIVVTMADGDNIVWAPASTATTSWGIDCGEATATTSYLMATTSCGHRLDGDNIGGTRRRQRTLVHVRRRWT